MSFKKHALQVKERWATIEDLPEYQVSNTGRVRSLKSNKPKEMKVYIPKRGGCGTVTFTHKGKKIKRSVPRLVAHYFIRPVKKHETVFLKDGNKANNYVTNLRIGTYSNQKRVSKSQLENYIELHRLSILAYSQNSSADFYEGVKLAFDVVLEALKTDIKKDIFQDKREQELFQLLCQTACEHKITLSDLRGGSRKQKFVAARREFVKRALPKFSYNEVAEAINVHRSTIYNYL